MTVSFITNNYVGNMQLFLSWLDESLERLILDGAENFYIGCNGAINIIAAQTLNDLRVKYPQIHTTLILTYPDKPHLHSFYDEIICPLPDAPRKFTSHLHRRWMIAHSDVMLVPIGKSTQMMENDIKYAEKHGKKLLILRP